MPCEDANNDMDGDTGSGFDVDAIIDVAIAPNTQGSNVETPYSSGVRGPRVGPLAVPTHNHDVVGCHVLGCMRV